MFDPRAPVRTYCTPQSVPGTLLVRGTYRQCALVLGEIAVPRARRAIFKRGSSSAFACVACVVLQLENKTKKRNGGALVSVILEQGWPHHGVGAEIVLGNGYGTFDCWMLQWDVFVKPSPCPRVPVSPCPVGWLHKSWRHCYKSPPECPLKKQQTAL